MMLVVGSGPSGISCAYTLLKANHKVTLIDAGFTQEKEIEELVTNYRKNLDKNELIQNIHKFRKSYSKQSDVQPAKTLFGSDYPYRNVPGNVVENDDKSVIRSSLAKGGFSTVWGATVSCVVPKDISDWPVSFDDLKPYYSTLEEIMDISSPKDELTEIFPVNIGQTPAFPLGKQGSSLFECLSKYKKDLAEDGVYFGRAKLAIGPKYSVDGKGCTPCGLCMHGCPNNAIFSSVFLLDKLQKNDNFTYLPGKLALRFSEDSNEVRLLIKDINTGEKSSLRCSRLFLACGVINTTCITARSLHITDHEFIIKDSQKYLFPVLTWHRAKGALTENENTASQIYMDIDNPSISSHIVHLQYYGYNDLYLEPLRQKLGSITEYLPKLFKAFFERLMMCFVYFHSDDSGYLSLRVNDPDSGHKSMGEIKGYINPESAFIMKSVMQLLKKHRHSLGGIPLTFGLQATLPGDSQHIGSTLPMSGLPDPYKTDRLGRPYGCSRVHIVDSSVLPSVPGTPITPTAMINACRIADSVNSKSPEGTHV
jgi:choline dehydrogenase-like flavoprotein